MGMLRSPDVLVVTPDDAADLLLDASAALCVCFSGDKSSSGIGLQRVPKAFMLCSCYADKTSQV